MKSQDTSDTRSLFFLTQEVTSLAACPFLQASGVKSKLKSCVSPCSTLQLSVSWDHSCYWDCMGGTEKLPRQGVQGLY